MKRFVTTLLVLLFVLSLCGCNEKKEVEYAKAAVAFLEEEYFLEDIISCIVDDGVWVEVNSEPTDYSAEYEDEPTYKNIIARVKVRWQVDDTLTGANCVYLDADGKVDSYYQWMDPESMMNMAIEEFSGYDNAIFMAAAVKTTTERRNDAYCPDDTSDWGFVGLDNLR